MVLRQKRHAIGIFFSRINVEHALGELKHTGFPVNQVAIVAKDANCDDHLDLASRSDRSQMAVQEEAAVGAIAGSMVGAIVGCFTGLGMLSVPGVSLIAAVGTTATALTTALAGAGIGAVAVAGLAAGLTRLDSDRASFSGDRCSQSEFLIIVDGANDEVDLAESILSQSCASKVWVC